MLAGKSEGKTSLGRHRHRWKDIKTAHQEMGLGGGGMNWMGPAQVRDMYRAVVNAIMNLRVS